MRRLEASNQLERKDLESYALCSLLVIVLDFAPARLPRHVRCVCPTFLILVLLIKHMLPVKRLFFC